MRKITTILILFVVSLSFTFGQTSLDTISMKKVFGGYQFYLGYKRLNMNQLVKTIKSNDQAYHQIKSAQSSYILSNIIGGVGGFMVGWPLGTAIGGGKPNWTMAGIGAGLIVVSIPITQSFNKKAKQAVETFNGGLQTSSYMDTNKLKFMMTGNGIGLTLNF